MTVTREQIVAEAREWLGVRFQHQASLKGVACDCIGLVRGVARGVGFADPFETGEAQRFLGYGRQPEPEALRMACAMFLTPIAIADCTLGDVLVFRIKSAYPMHFALMSSTDPARMIHGFANAKKVAENNIDAVWRGRLYAAHRFREIA